MRFKCNQCNDYHDANDLSYGGDAPIQWSIISEGDRIKSLIGNDQCEILVNNEYSYYIRACLEIPIINTPKVFTWGVWCSLSEKSYAEVLGNWENPNREKIGPHFGWLCSKLPDYPDTVYMKTMVHQRGLGLRPLVILEPSEHPLSVHQYSGIDTKDLINRISNYLHSSS
jgi:hypothetical protein